MTRLGPPSGNGGFLRTPRHGFLFLEACAGLILFLAAVLVFSEMFHASVVGAEIARGTERLVAAAENRLEEIRGLPPADLAGLDGKAFEVPGLPGSAGRTEVKPAGEGLFEIRVTASAPMRGAPRGAPPKAVTLTTLQRAR
ncbi:MAG: hypothetical protein AAB215_08405 [Planctomycetota bacterium]